ncbi:hypothetical protein LBMAG52_37140 [Planctomycetia bacterium]|nr:hypothetical protein LBMAG52_37140 [Planctomycetia bacterium]
MSDAFGRVDLSTFKTAEVRDLYARHNVRVAKLEIERHRFQQVVKEFCFFTESTQFDLADRAVLWALAALLPHDRREECKAVFYAKIDLMYAETDDAHKLLTESEKQQLIVAATAAQDYVADQAIEVVKESGKRLNALQPDGPRKSTGKMLVNIRGMLEVAEPAHVLDLILQCSLMCDVVDYVQSGYEDTDNMCLKQILTVNLSCGRIVESVLSAVDDGKLVVRDGSFVMLQEGVAGE